MYLSAFPGPNQSISLHPAVSCDCPCMENVGLYRVELGILGRGVVLKQDVSGSQLFLLQIVESWPPLIFLQENNSEKQEMERTYLITSMHFIVVEFNQSWAHCYFKSINR